MDRKTVFIDACDILSSEGFEASIDEEYAGRGMNGRTTTAIITDAPGVMVGRAVTEVCLEDPDDPLNISEFLPRNSDGMGLQSVFY